MEAHRIHRLMFYNLEPISISCMCFSAANELLAVLRSDNRIEIWDMTATPYIQNTILLKKQAKLKGMTWCGKRLFGADLEGFVTEMDLLNLTDKKSYPVTSGGPCHCLAVNKMNTLLAVGTELGFINVFKIEENGLAFQKLIQSEKRRILTICWDASSNYIITGELSKIKLFNYKDRSLVHFMEPIGKSIKKQVAVWSVAITDDFTIIAGDSSGNLSFWDGKQGVCMDVIRSHMSDILTICLSDDQNSVFCAGIDPVIRSYNRLKMKDGTIKWVKSTNIVNHTHDVNSIIQLKDGRLCSGGFDSYLTVSRPSPFSVRLYPPLMQNPTIYVATEARYVLARYSMHLELWEINNSLSEDSCKEPCVKLVELHSMNNELIRCAAMSNDGSFIVYATSTCVRVFKFLCTEDKPKLEPLHLTGCSLESVYNVCFSKDNQRLIMSDNKSQIEVYSTSSKDLLLLHNIVVTDKPPWSENSISLLATSYNGDYVAVGCSDGHIGIWKKNTFRSFLPRYKLPATAIAFHPNENIFYAMYSDFMFVEYSLDKLHYTSFSKKFDSTLLEKYLKGNELPVTNITFDHDRNDVIILHTSSTICIFDKNKVTPVEHKNKRMRLDPAIQKLPFKKGKKRFDQDHILKSNFVTLESFYKQNNSILSEKDLAEDSGFHVYEKYQHLVHFHNFGNREMIAVEVKPQNFLNKLPPVLKKNRFGRK